jgi:hypothetical protein
VREKDSQCGSSAPNSWPLNPRHPVSSVYATATSSDKDADGRKLWFGFLGTLSGSQRATMAAEMSEEANEICRSGIRARHPDRINRNSLDRKYLSHWADELEISDLMDEALRAAIN